MVSPAPPKELPTRSDKVQKTKNFTMKPGSQGPASSFLVRWHPALDGTTAQCLIGGSAANGLALCEIPICFEAVGISGLRQGKVARELCNSLVSGH